MSASRWIGFRPKAVLCIQTSKKLGMTTLDDYLLELFRKGLISREVALETAQDDKDLEVRL